MISPDGEARTYFTVVLPTSMPQTIAPLALGRSLTGVLISITPVSRMRGAIWMKLPSAIGRSCEALFCHAATTTGCHSERSEESLCSYIQIEERFLAPLGMTKNGYKLAKCSA